MTFVGPLEVIKRFAPKLVNGSSIVIISGITSKIHLTNYFNTNVLRLTWFRKLKNLTNFLSYNSIRINSISPGIILTKFNIEKIQAKAIGNNISFKAHLDKDTECLPFKQYGQVKNISDLTMFLLNEKSLHINSENFALDKGQNNCYW